jgi:uncharacterized protein YgbK (DUF1537 family)
MPPSAASARVTALAADLAGRRVYKKVDSVLRGPVRAELDALLAATKHRRALLVPANPALGRTIRDGRYYVSGRPLDETDFAHDPEYPARNSDVRERLATGGAAEIRLCRPGAPLPDSGLLVGEATTAADLDYWAAVVDQETLPAGAAAFFAALLRQEHAEMANPAPERAAVPRGPALFVCGSSCAPTRSFVAQMEARGVAVVRMPDDVFSLSPRQGAINAWVEATASALAAQGQAVVAVDRAVESLPGLPQALSRHTALLVERLLKTGYVSRVHAEGGATAAAIVRRMGWTRLRVREVLAPGVVALVPVGSPGLELTIKPGSYRWPEEWHGT